MLKITADTNILVSATISHGNEFELLKLAKTDQITLVLSPQILKEFEEVISRDKFGFTQKQVEEAVKEVLDLSMIVIPIEPIVAVKEDPDDNKVIECAVCGGCDIIVSGDWHLLNMGAYQRIPIITTTDCLRMIKKSATS